MTDINSGLTAWQQTSNHNRMIALQEDNSPPPDNSVEVAYFGSSAFRIKSPLGITVMVDPWRNHPSRTWDWYFHDFPVTEVDIGVCTHAHFDHDALHRLDAHVLLDRLIGTYTFKDVTITGIAEKHAIDSSCCVYDFKKIHKHVHGVDIEPPDNPRSWDHCLIVVETGAIRILHWGDNRPDPPDSVWAALGRIDIVLVPVDNSQHVMGHRAVDAIIERLRPRVIVPHHYYIWDMVQRQSTLQSPDVWVDKRDKTVRLDGPTIEYRAEEIAKLDGVVHYFGDYVAFDKQRWFAEGR